MDLPWLAYCRRTRLKSKAPYKHNQGQLRMETWDYSKSKVSSSLSLISWDFPSKANRSKLFQAMMINQNHSHGSIGGGVLDLNLSCSILLTFKFCCYPNSILTRTRDHTIYECNKGYMCRSPLKVFGTKRRAMEFGLE